MYFHTTECKCTYVLQAMLKRWWTHNCFDSKRSNNDTTQHLPHKSVILNVKPGFFQSFTSEYKYTQFQSMTHNIFQLQYVTIHVPVQNHSTIHVHGQSTGRNLLLNDFLPQKHGQQRVDVVCERQRLHWNRYHGVTHFLRSMFSLKLKHSKSNTILSHCFYILH